MSKESETYFAINHVYSIYARAIDEKRFDLLRRVFTDDAELEYTVGVHQFSCRGDEAGGAFGNFLKLCYWTNHLIASPMVEPAGARVFATARVQATHLQRRADGSINRWFLRGSYHDHFELREGQWLIARRLCVCTDEQGEFVADGVEQFDGVAWADPAALTSNGV